MTNLEYMGKYNIARLEISQLSDEQLQAYIEEKRLAIEKQRIEIQAAENTLRERGKSVKVRVKEEDMKYVPPAQVQRNSLTKYLEKKGESAQKILDFQRKLEAIDFDDL